MPLVSLLSFLHDIFTELWFAESTHHLFPKPQNVTMALNAKWPGAGLGSKYPEYSNKTGKRDFNSGNPFLFQTIFHLGPAEKVPFFTVPTDCAPFFLKVLEQLKLSFHGNATSSFTIFYSSLCSMLFVLTRGGSQSIPSPHSIPSKTQRGVQAE